MNQYLDFDNPYSLQALGRYKNEEKEFLNKKAKYRIS